MAVPDWPGSLQVGPVRSGSVRGGVRAGHTIVVVHRSNPDAGPPDPDRLEGRIGRVTVPIPDGGPGEIVVAIRGGTERFAAWCDDPVAKHASVVVVDVRSPRTVTVTPFPEADSL